jgi:hypothetical protein
MTFEVTYEGLFGSGIKTQVLDAEGIDQAKQKFLHVKSGVPESRIKDIREIVIVPLPSRQIVWTDKRTGDQLSARSDFIEKLPTLLKYGKDNATHVEEILSAMGVENNDGTRRQLRFAKAYIIANSDTPICSERSQDGGYFIATTRNDVLEDAETYRASAAGNIRAAEELESLADRAFPQEVTCAPSIVLQ